MIDFHSHILPEVDHGASSLDVSVNMLKQAQKAGVVKIVATPHFYMRKDTIDFFLKRRCTALSLLTNYIAQDSSCDIRIIPAAEVALDRNLLSIDLPQLKIGNTNYILIEMPQNCQWFSWMFDILYEIESKFSLSVILAHVDRYPEKYLEQLLDLGFVLQINAESLIGHRFFTKKRLISYCKKGLIHLIGSDAHDETIRSYSGFISASRKLPQTILNYFESNANEILI